MSNATTYITEYGPLLLSAIAIFVSWRANSHAKKSLTQSERVKLLEVQGNVLREIDLQHAKLGSLLALTAETALVYAQNSKLRETDADGIDRIKQNIAVIEDIRAQYEEQRSLAEQNFGQGNIKEQTSILANVRRLTLHVEEDIEKERRHLATLKIRN